MGILVTGMGWGGIFLPAGQGWREFSPCEISREIFLTFFSSLTLTASPSTFPFPFGFYCWSLELLSGFTAGACCLELLSGSAAGAWKALSYCRSAVGAWSYCRDLLLEPEEPGAAVEICCWEWEMGTEKCYIYFDINWWRMEIPVGIPILVNRGRRGSPWPRGALLTSLAKIDVASLFIKNSHH
ncbi:hypothetical protein SLEP1_g35140 [Rubroshorea leprosula]|uniref:Uncharacterized protein n=1 Tax=Rubroshorea leprosula TaxID=152421 RepID=A0AAV5KMA5_9ROSI|nr:hypothetical protein SLEP1_g35140 [Rubroshorea leprosula]